MKHSQGNDNAVQGKMFHICFPLYTLFMDCVKIYSVCIQHEVMHQRQSISLILPILFFK